MDIFAHVAWTNIVFYKKLRLEKLQRYLTVLFGVLPDFVSFVPVFVYMIFSGQNFLDLAGSDVWVMKYASESYNYTHSIVIFLLAYVLVIVFRRFVLNIVYKGSLLIWPMFGWLLHILIDIPSHKGFYETPFLFPLSSYRFEHGVSWGHPTFMLINYSLLVAIYAVWFLALRRKKVKQNVV